MVSLSMNGILQELMLPALILGGGAAGEAFFEKKNKPGIALAIKLAAAAIFIFVWFLPLLDRISWLFRGAMSLPLFN